jgi:transposase
MENQAVQEEEHNAVLYVAMELSRRNWRVGFSDGKMAKIREVTIEAGDLERLRSEIEKAKKKWSLSESVGVRSCYEAGREGFWVHRALTEMGIVSRPRKFGTVFELDLFRAQRSER